MNNEYAMVVEIIASIMDITKDICNFKPKGKTIKKTNEGMTINKIL